MTQRSYRKHDFVGVDIEVGMYLCYRHTKNVTITTIIALDS